MNEFQLIKQFFETKAFKRNDVVFGVGDDAACLDVPLNHQLLVSTDTLVEGVHFLDSFSPYDIAYRAVMVNLSDIAAMGAKPAWISLALTLPYFDSDWLKSFAKGLHDALNLYEVALIGGDTTRGPLSLTFTIHGLVEKGKSVRRNGAKDKDKIYVSGPLGASVLAVLTLSDNSLPEPDKTVIMDKLLHPVPRLDLQNILQQYASAAIDISDGLSADLNHICEQSKVGASLFESLIPIHPLVQKYKGEEALSLALSGGDDYELCFTIPPQNEDNFLKALHELNLKCYLIGVIDKQKNLRLIDKNDLTKPLEAKGYSHF